MRRSKPARKQRLTRLSRLPRNGMSVRAMAHAMGVAFSTLSTATLVARMKELTAGVRKVLYTVQGDRGAITVDDDELQIATRPPPGDGAGSELGYL